MNLVIENEFSDFKLKVKNSDMILTYNVSYSNTNSMDARWCARPGECFKHFVTNGHNYFQAQLTDV